MLKGMMGERILPDNSIRQKQVSDASADSLEEAKRESRSTGPTLRDFCG